MYGIAGIRCSFNEYYKFNRLGRMTTSHTETKVDNTDQDYEVRVHSL